MIELINIASACVISDNPCDLPCYQREFQSRLFDLADETILSRLWHASDSLDYIWSVLQNTSVLNAKHIPQSASLPLAIAISSRLHITRSDEDIATLIGRPVEDVIKLREDN
jgi:hypothetical protein